MAVILGIDAAWTALGSSGVALLQSRGRERHVIGVAPSYAGFLELAGGRQAEWRKPPCGAPNVGQILEAAKSLAGARVDVVAIDMPMSTNSISGYRTADRKLSSSFGAMQASTHTPNIERPGYHGERITMGFTRCGFHLGTVKGRSMPSIIEVFPLAGLVLGGG